MNKHLQDLIQVAYLDKQIDDLEPKIAQVRHELNETIKQREQILKNIESLDEEIHKLELEITRHNRNIEESSLKLEQISKKQKEIKTEKEMRAIDVESDIAKENMTYSNAEIERLEALKIHKEKEKVSFEPELDELKKKIATLETQTQSEIDAIKKSQHELFNEKESIISKMDSKITSFYAKIRRWALNTSVVPVYKQACGGCYIRLNDTIYSEIIEGANIVNCPHCGRILYIQSTQVTAEDKPKKKTKA